MKVKSEFFRVWTGPTPDGHPVDVEGRPLQRVIESAASVRMNTGQPVNIPGMAPELPTQVITESSVLTAANAQRWICRTCKFFDKKYARALLEKWNDPSSPMEDRQALNNLRAGLLMTQNAELHDMHQGEDGEMDVEHILQTLGYCHALSQVHDAVRLVHPQACCPTEVQTVQSPQGYWASRKGDARLAEGTAAYDATFRLAQGKQP